MNPAYKILIIILVAIFLINACGGPQANSNSNANLGHTAQANSNPAKTNVEELGLLINVPYESEEVFWKDDQQNKKIVAVLRFPAGEANRLVADAQKVRPPQKVSINSESWFPQELIAQSDMSGDDMLGGQSYAANAFFQDAYNDGRIIHIDDTDYFVLEMSAK
jgi:hypothetical protein